MSLSLIEARDRPNYFNVLHNDKLAGTLFIDESNHKYYLDVHPRCCKHIRGVVRRIVPYEYEESQPAAYRFGMRKPRPRREEGGSTAKFTVGMKSGRTADTASSKQCSHVLVIEPDTAKKLQSLSKDVFFLDKDKKKVGKEFFGRLNVIPAADGRLILTYDDNIVTGDKDGIDGFEDLITYHTHPFPTYIDFDAKYAWPSHTDYKSIFETLSHGKGVVHIVVTVEGVYVVSLGDHWCENTDRLADFVKTKDMSYKFVMNNLDAEYPYRSKKNKGRKEVPFKTPHEFVKHANSLTLDGHQLLHTQFLAWDHPELKFRVRSPIMGSSCKLATDN